jgi:hypothetical protein
MRAPKAAARNQSYAALAAFSRVSVALAAAVCAATLLASCVDAEKPYPAPPGATWIRVDSSGARVEKSPLENPTPMTPWPNAFRVSALVSGGDGSGGPGALALINGWGAVSFAAGAEAISMSPTRLREFSGRTIGSAFRLAPNAKPKSGVEPGDVVADLYSNTLLGGSPKSDPPSLALALGKGLKAVALPLVQYGLLDRNGYQSTAIAPLADAWLITRKPYKGGGGETEYSFLTPEGARKQLSEGEYVTLYEAAYRKPCPKALAAELRARGMPDAYVLANDWRGGPERLYYLSPEDARAADEDRPSPLYGEACYAFETASGDFYLITREDPNRLLVLRDGKASSYDLPALPEGFEYTGIVVCGGALIASWEEGEWPEVGRAGLLVMPLRQAAR